jgi:thiol-disulfide isomerase/thioredoxin
MLETHEAPMSDSPDAAARRGRPSPALILFALLPLAGLIIAVGVLLADRDTAGRGDAQANDGAVGVAVAPTRPPLVRLDYPADEFIAPTLDGSAVALSDYRGRVVFLNFWGTWCPPCVRELPALEQFAREQGADGAAVLASNNTEDAETITTYLDDNDITLDHVEVLLDIENTVYRRFAIPAMPTTYVIDGEGIVRYVKYGELKLEELYGYLDALENADAG